jgi:phage/plasmid-like protein (TIGR03299 family)
MLTSKSNEESNMTAGITKRADGKHEMAYVGEKPWWQGGQALTAEASIDDWILQAGMEWQAHRAPVTFQDEAGQVHTLEGQYVLHRSDNNLGLGVVSSKYEIVQPRETLEFFRDLVGEAGYQLETAGTIYGGKIFWAMATIGDEAVVLGEDKLKSYLLCASSLDGSLATTFRDICERVVCRNTLAIGLKESPNIQVRVSHRSIYNAEKVKEQLGLSRGRFREFVLETRKLAKHSISSEKADEFIEQLLLDTGTIFSKEPRKAKHFQTIKELFEGVGEGAHLKGAEGTLWGLLNGITEFVDHKVKAKTDHHRLDSAWFGRGADLKNEARNRLLALV